MDKEHILFVNISENQIYNFAKVFVEKCDEKKLPYDFKFALVEQRDDGFQIYTDSEHLVDFINIVEEIKEKYPTLINVNKDTPLLTGEISKGLSYGTYNKEHGELSYQDYFQLRCNIVASSINSTIVDYIRKNKNRSLEYHGMKMPLYEYLALKAKDKYIENLKSEKNLKNFLYNKKNKKSIEIIEIHKYILNYIKYSKKEKGVKKCQNL